MLSHYVKLILTARVYDVARKTPLDPAPELSRRLGNRVWIKREDLQPVFSYKLRGAYNLMYHLGGTPTMGFRLTRKRRLSLVARSRRLAALTRHDGVESGEVGAAAAFLEKGDRFHGS